MQTNDETALSEELNRRINGTSKMKAQAFIMEEMVPFIMDEVKAQKEIVWSQLIYDDITIMV